MYLKPIDLTSAREDLSNLVDDVYLNKNKAYVVYKRKIPLAMLVKFEPGTKMEKISGKMDMSLFGIWKGKSRDEVMAGIKRTAWKSEGGNVN